MARILKYPFTKMNIGDHRVLTFDTKGQANKARACAYTTGLLKDFTFETKVVDNVLEVWRTK